MGLNNLADFSDALLNLGVDKSMPVQILSKVSQPNQKKYNTELNEVRNFLNIENPETPAVIIVGKFAKPI